MEAELTENVGDYSVPTNLKTIPEVEDIPYSTFFQEFIVKNRPCKIIGLPKNWICAEKWVINGKPNFTYLKNTYGCCDVPVYNCNKRHYNSQYLENWKFDDYIKYWQSFIDKGYCSVDSPVLYLKDWHLQQECDNLEFYEVPFYFISDWLNEYLSDCKVDDYRFVYMGPKGSWTPFHVDVFTSFSWSTNICGRKKWLFFPPGEKTVFKDIHGNLLYDIQHLENDENCLVVYQDAGESIFVPSGWFHQVWNLEDTISINHNWVNGCNIETMWMSLTEHLVAVKKEISDCADSEQFLDYTQNILKASFGMNFINFYDFIKHISVKRINLLSKNHAITLFKYTTLGKNHAIFDLKLIQHVLNLYLKHEDVHLLKHMEEHTIKPQDLQDNINCTLSQFQKNKI